MRKIFFAIFFLPSVNFSQGVGKTNLGFTTGLSIPTANKEFRESHDAGFIFNINVEHTVTPAFTLGGELDFARQTGQLIETYGGGLVSVKDNAYQFFALDGFMKIQNNLAKENEGQFYLKAGGGIWGASINKSLGVGGITVLFGPGFNYMPGNNMKITSGIEYRINLGRKESEPISLLQLKIGFSFCLNPR